MLGVMTIRKDELKFREFDRYRGFTADCATPSGSGAAAHAAWR